MSVENTHFGAAAIGERLAACRSIYFIGIGGINMSSLAHISHLRGFHVGGSDRVRTALTEKLEKCGIDIAYEHDASRVDSYDAVVYTVAIAPDNPEFLRAKERGILCVSRADYLGYIMTGYENRIGISGMHGKSTCTSMCACVFMNAGVDPTVLSGAELDLMNGAYRIGYGRDFIFEACEYMDSFLDFNPTTAVLLNVDLDHVDYFHSMEQICDSYRKFIGITGEEGFVIANADNDYTENVLRGYPGSVLTFGILHKNADFSAINIRYPDGFPEFDVMHGGEFFAHVRLAVTGEHNIYNALAATAAAYLSRIEPKKIAEGLALFHGANRRLEYKGRIHGAAVYDDYGHHPAEVRATLEGVNRRDHNRLFVVFQPHTYSRTAGLLDDFAAAFDVADRVLLADVYAARETDTLGVSSAILADRIGEKAQYYDSFEAIADELKNSLMPDDIAVVMGAGDVYRVFDALTFDEK